MLKQLENKFISALEKVLKRDRNKDYTRYWLNMKKHNGYFTTFEVIEVRGYYYVEDRIDVEYFRPKTGNYRDLFTHEVHVTRAAAEAEGMDTVKAEYQRFLKVSKELEQMFPDYAKD